MHWNRSRNPTNLHCKLILWDHMRNLPGFLLSTQDWNCYIETSLMDKTGKMRQSALYQNQIIAHLLPVVLVVFARFPVKCLLHFEACILLQSAQKYRKQMNGLRMLASAIEDRILWFAIILFGLTYVIVTTTNIIFLLYYSQRLCLLRYGRPIPKRYSSVCTG